MPVKLSASGAVQLLHTGKYSLSSSHLWHRTRSSDYFAAQSGASLQPSLQLPRKLRSPHGGVALSRGGLWDLPGPEWAGTCSPWGSSWRGKLSSAQILSVQTPQGAQGSHKRVFHLHFGFKMAGEGCNPGAHRLPMAICRLFSKRGSQVLSLPSGAGGRCRWAERV